MQRFVFIRAPCSPSLPEGSGLPSILLHQAGLSCHEKCSLYFCSFGCPFSQFNARLKIWIGSNLSVRSALVKIFLDRFTDPKRCPTSLHNATIYSRNTSKTPLSRLYQIRTLNFRFNEEVLIGGSAK